MKLETAHRNRQTAIASFLAWFIVIAGCSQPRSESAVAETIVPPPTSIPLPQAALPDGFVVDLELATTPEETTTGLMFRPSLPLGRGMLLLWEEERHATIWMMNVLIPLDIVFLDNAGMVVEVVTDAQPCNVEPCPRFTSGVPARAVLEVAAGSVVAHGLEVGSIVEFHRVPGYPTAEVQLEEN